MEYSPRIQLLFSMACSSMVWVAFAQSASAAPALKPPLKERERLLQLARLSALETQSRGQFERVKVGKDTISTLLDLVEEIGRTKRNLAETPDNRVNSTIEMLQTLTIVEAQCKELVAAGILTPDVVQKVGTARRRASDLLKALTGDP